MVSKFGMLCTGFVVTANWAISLGMMVPMSYYHNKFCLQLPVFTCQLSFRILFYLFPNGVVLG